MRYTIAACLFVGSLFLAVPHVTVADADSERIAVVDHVGEEHAVVLIEHRRNMIEQVVVPLDTIAEAGRYEGAVLSASRCGYRYLPSESDTRHRMASSRLDDLSERL